MCCAKFKERNHGNILGNMHPCVPASLATASRVRRLSRISFLAHTSLPGLLVLVLNVLSFCSRSVFPFGLLFCFYSYSISYARYHSSLKYRCIQQTAQTPPSLLRASPCVS